MSRQQRANERHIKRYGEPEKDDDEEVSEISGAEEQEEEIEEQSAE
jgi:hypothetical protein